VGYSFTAKWIKGKGNNAPDVLSRNPVSDSQWNDTLAEFDHQHQPELSITEIRLLHSDQNDSARLHKLSEEASKDPDYQQLHHIITHGFPDHCSQLPEACRCFWNVREHLTIDDGLIVYGRRLLIPELTMLFGHVKMPRLLTLTAKSHWFLNLQIAIDFCSYGGHQFLIIVDCFTDWPEIVSLRTNTSTQHLVQALTGSFCRTAVPDVVWSDGGLQFTSRHFSDSATQWGFEHRTSSPHYPQSNGKIEATVKSMKKIIASSCGNRSVNVNSMCRVLLQYRNTPSCKDGQSPAQKLFGRPIQDTLPAHYLLNGNATPWKQSSWHNIR